MDRRKRVGLGGAVAAEGDGDEDENDEAGVHLAALPTAAASVAHEEDGDQLLRLPQRAARVSPVHCSRCLRLARVQQTLPLLALSARQLSHRQRALAGNHQSSPGGSKRVMGERTHRLPARLAPAFGLVSHGGESDGSLSEGEESGEFSGE